jgi:hypothetical protein
LVLVGKVGSRLDFATLDVLGAELASLGVAERRSMRRTCRARIVGRRSGWIRSWSRK